MLDGINRAYNLNSQLTAFTLNYALTQLHDKQRFPKGHRRADQLSTYPTVKSTLQ